MANSDVIAGIYEIHQQIGAGGGGTVYLGRHLRLQKLVVLKADKRSLSAKEETLRRRSGYAEKSESELYSAGL